MLKDIRIFLHQIGIPRGCFLTGHFDQPVMDAVIIQNKEKSAELSEFRNIMEVMLYSFPARLPKMYSL